MDKEIIELFIEFSDKLMALDDDYTEEKGRALLAIGRNLRDKIVEFRNDPACPEDTKATFDKELPGINEIITNLNIQFGVN